METAINNCHPGAAINMLFFESGKYDLDAIVEETGLPLNQLNQILSGKLDINESLSGKLSKAFNMKDEQFWFRLQQRYDAGQLGTISSFNRKQALESFKHKENAILAAMAAGIAQSGSNDKADFTYTRIQVMNLMYFIDREMGEKAELKFFNFRPTKYGAFDEDINLSVQKLADKGFIRIYGDGFNSKLELTKSGLKVGKEYLARVTSTFTEYFKETANWIKSKDFETIVWTAYSMCPELKTEESHLKSKELEFEEQCDLVLDRIFHRRQKLFNDFGFHDCENEEDYDEIELTKHDFEGKFPNENVC